VVTAAVVEVASLVVTRHRVALNGSDGVGKMVRSAVKVWLKFEDL